MNPPPFARWLLADVQVDAGYAAAVAVAVDPGGPALSSVPAPGGRTAQGSMGDSLSGAPFWKPRHVCRSTEVTGIRPGRGVRLRAGSGNGSGRAGSRATAVRPASAAARGPR